MENEPLDIGQFKDGPVDEATEAARLSLARRLKRMAWIFYTMAALTFVCYTSASLYFANPFHSGIQLVVYRTLIRGQFEWQVASLITYGVLMVLYIFLGVMLSRKKIWPLWAGMIVYALDVLPLTFSRYHWLDVAVHAVFLYLIIRGLVVVREMLRAARPHGF
jgi:hypothetical protein